MKRITLLSVLVFFSIAGSASANYWTKESGIRKLHEPGGGVIEEYDAGEWKAVTNEDTAIRECEMSTSLKCSGPLEKKELGMAHVNPQVAKAAEHVVNDGREAGKSLNGEVTAPLTALVAPPVVAGGVDAYGAALFFGTVAEATGAFALGLGIGYGIDEIFEIGEFGEEAEAERVKKTKTETCTPSFTYHTEREVEGYYKIKEKLPAGYYAECGGSYAATEVKVNMDESECGPSEYKSPRFGMPNSLSVVELFEEGNGKGGHEEACHKDATREVIRIFEWVEPNCYVAGETVAWLEGLGVPCHPAELPAPGTLTPEIEKSNKEHGFPEKPESEELKPFTPGKAPNVTEERVEKTVELPAPRKYIREHGKKTPKELKEAEEEEELEVPFYYPNELGTEYKTELESIGFTNVELRTLPEVDINPSVGPNEVASVTPSEGSRVKSTTKINVEQNPEDAPVPGEPPHEGIGGPTLPGIKLPSFPVLCKGFPFGVPCWLIQTIEGWSATGTAPELGIENFEVEKHTVVGAKFRLSHLEPIMEKVRPAMLIFATIGLVLLFYRFAKGGGPPSGGIGDSSSDEPAEGSM